VRAVESGEAVLLLSATAISAPSADPSRPIMPRPRPEHLVTFQSEVAPAPKPKGDMSFELADGTKVRLVDPAKR